MPSTWFIDVLAPRRRADMSKTRALRECVRVRSRYQRSVTLERDWSDDGWLDGYILTPSGRGILDRIASSLNGASASRCWSIIGPYGSGKSAFALFAAKVLSLDTKRRQRVLAKVGVEKEAIWKSLFPETAGGKNGRLLPIVVSGGRGSINDALIVSLLKSLDDTSTNPTTKTLRRKCRKLIGGHRSANSTKAIVELFGEVADSVAQLGPGYRGVILVIDEMGKFLEHAAANPSEGDVFILQELAELAARHPKPFIVLSVLHQSMDCYAANLSQSRRVEWQKVQGRYEDIAFEESSAQILRLISNAIEHIGTKDETRCLTHAVDKVAKGVLPAASDLSGISEAELQGLLASCAPLHPLVSMSLGPLFRRLAQNERSLFAFLTSAEPFGFQEALDSGRAKGDAFPLYRLDQLYDYVSSALGPSLFTQHRGRLWAEVDSALDRLKNGPVLEQQLAKTIGLLQVLGYGTGMPASEAVLRAALTMPGVSAKQVDAAVSSLVKRSIVTYRRHADSYALWEGSDIDVEARIREARRHVEPAKGLAPYLTAHTPPRPILAKKHAFQTGTLRYFDVCYVDGHTIQRAIDAGFGDADGRVLLAVPSSSEERQAMAEVLGSPAMADKVGMLGVVPANVLDLKEACIELACLRWVGENTPELASDATARKEMRARIATAERQVRRELERCFRPSSRGQGGAWYHKGTKQRPRGSRKVQELVSKVCDELYPNTPVLKNELVNRRALSSSAAAARRNLIEAMIEQQKKPLLGIEGTPAERSIYDCLLKRPGLHREENGVWSFLPPLRKKGGIHAVWKTIDRFLADCERERKSVSVLFETLRAPPFGLKDGVLPVLLAAALIHFDSEVALYEQGSFVPSLTTAVFERILRSPAEFDVQRCRIAGPRTEVFNQYAALVAAKGEQSAGDKPRLLSVVRQLLSFVRLLPEHVSKTEQISPTARNVLRAIREAKEPDQLLFSDLPTACGVQPFPSRGALKPKEIESFFGALRAALAELQQAYPKLLAKVEDLVFKAFSLGRPLSQARTELTHRCKLIGELAVDQKLRAFVTRVLDATSDDNVWLESIAALLGVKPSAAWSDQDTARFEVSLAMTARTMGHFEILAYEAEQSGAAILDGDATALRFSVTALGEDIERVVRIPREARERVLNAQASVRSVLGEAGLLDDSELGVAALAELARELLRRRSPAESQKQ